MSRLLKYASVLPLCIQFSQSDNKSFNYKKWIDLEKCSIQKMSEKIEISLNEYEKTKTYCDNSFKLFLSDCCKEQLKTIDDVYKLSRLPLLTTYDDYLFSFIEKEIEKILEDKNISAYNKLRNFIIENDLTTKIKNFKKYENQFIDIFKEELNSVIISKNYKRLEYYFKNYYDFMSHETIINYILINIDIEIDVILIKKLEFLVLNYPIYKSLIEKKVDEILIKYINMKDINKIKFIIDNYDKFIDISILANDIDLIQYFLNKSSLSSMYIRGFDKITYITIFEKEKIYTGGDLHLIILNLCVLNYFLNSYDDNKKENIDLLIKIKNINTKLEKNISLTKNIIIFKILQNSYETDNDINFIELCKKIKKLITLYDFCEKDIFQYIRIIEHKKNEKKNIFLKYI